MKKILLIIFVLLILTGCQRAINTLDEQSDDYVVEQKQFENQQTEQMSGVYYEKIPAKQVEGIYDDMSLYAYATLYYNGYIYTSSGIYDCRELSEEEKNFIMGEKLGSVYGNHGVYWSDNSNKLTEITTDGLVYKANGYDTDFRLCIHYVDLTSGGEELIIFDKLNDINLRYGSELFSGLLKLDEAKIYYVDYEAFPMKRVALEDTLAEDLKTAICNGEFIDENSENYSDISSTDVTDIEIEDNLGITYRVSIYPEGYACIYTSAVNFVLQIDLEVCEEINMLHEY